MGWPWPSRTVTANSECSLKLGMFLSNPEGRLSLVLRSPWHCVQWRSPIWPSCVRPKCSTWQVAQRGVKASSGVVARPGVAGSGAIGDVQPVAWLPLRRRAWAARPRPVPAHGRRDNPSRTWRGRWRPVRRCTRARCPGPRPGSHSPASTGAATERMNFQRRNQCGSLKYDSPIRLARIFVDCWRDAIVASVPDAITACTAPSSSSASDKGTSIRSQPCRPVMQALLSATSCWRRRDRLQSLATDSCSTGGSAVRSSRKSVVDLAAVSRIPLRRCGRVEE